MAAQRMATTRILFSLAARFCPDGRLVTQLRDRHLLQQMPPQDGDFLFRRVVRASVASSCVRSIILAGERFLHFQLNRNKTFSVARLHTFASATPGRYLPLSDEALQLAADLWARARQQGRPTADVKDLDVDVILAAQALSFGPAPVDVIVATTNSKHLSQFIAAKDWQEIVP